MARKPDTPCAGCGKLLYSSPTSLPAGQRTCHECRRARRVDVEPKPQRICERCGESAVPTRSRYPICKACLLRTCEVCGTQYRRTYTGQRTCGRECGAWLSNGSIGAASAVPWCECECGQPFIARIATRCPQCSIPRPYVPAAPTARTCPECGITFLAKGTRVYCTERHAVAASRRVLKERRKGRMRDGDRVNRFGWRRLALRQGLDCHICGEPCDPNADPCEDDWAPTVDHIVPLSQGGTHTFDNARIAHRYCNSIRGVASVEEARGWLAA